MTVLKELQTQLQVAGHYVSMFESQLITNSMKTIYIDTKNRFVVQDDQTGEEHIFPEAVDVYDFMNETGDTKTMKAIMGTKAANGINVNHLLTLMTYHGISQKHLANLSGVSRVTMNRIIKGKVSVTIQTAQKIAEALNLTDQQIREIFFSKGESK